MLSVILNFLFSPEIKEKSKQFFRLLRHTYYNTVLFFSTPPNCIFFKNELCPHTLFSTFFPMIKTGILTKNRFYHRAYFISRENCLIILVNSPVTASTPSSDCFQLSFLIPSGKEGHTKNSVSGYTC